MQQSTDSIDFNTAIKSDDYVRAYEMIKRNPLQTIRKEQARVLLNNMRTISKKVEPSDKKALTVSVVFNLVLLVWLIPYTVLQPQNNASDLHTGASSDKKSSTQ